MDLLTGVLGGDGGELLLGDLLGWAFNHALCVLVAQFGTGANDGPTEPFTKDLQRQIERESGELFPGFSFMQPFIRTHSTKIYRAPTLCSEWRYVPARHEDRSDVEAPPLRELRLQGVDLRGSGGREKVSKHTGGTGQA